MLHKKRILFLCTENSCRSQMAEGFCRSVAPDEFDVNSAGSVATKVNPNAIRVMAEIGVDISHHRSKLISNFAGQAFDYVITVCDGSSAIARCPVFTGRAGERIHWPIEDPAQAKGGEQEVLAAFRRIRDQIKKRVERFAADYATAEFVAKRTGGKEK